MFILKIWLLHFDGSHTSVASKQNSLFYQCADDFDGFSLGTEVAFYFSVVLHILLLFTHFLSKFIVSWYRAFEKYPALESILLLPNKHFCLFSTSNAIVKRIFRIILNNRKKRGLKYSKICPVLCIIPEFFTVFSFVLKQKKQMTCTKCILYENRENLNLKLGPEVIYCSKDEKKKVPYVNHFHINCVPRKSFLRIPTSTFENSWKN